MCDQNFDTQVNVHHVKQWSNFLVIAPVYIFMSNAGQKFSMYMCYHQLLRPSPHLNLIVNGMQLIIIQETRRKAALDCVQRRL